MKRQLIIFQTIKSFLFILLAIELGSYLFGFVIPFNMALSTAAIGGLLSLIYSSWVLQDKPKRNFDGKIMIDQQQHTLSFRINLAVDELVEKGEVVLKVDDGTLNE